jgi:hypothetical protein
MLPETRETFCYRCHGSSSVVEDTREQGDLAPGTEGDDLQKEFNKPFRHPVEKTGIHIYGEPVPETNPSAERHAECAYCHHHHYVTTENKTAGIKGVNSQGVRVDRITFEYELCFKCHSYSANLPADQKNKADQFNIANASYHPVVASGKNIDVPSLIPPLTVASLIKCTDCHNNDDPLGPKGPHGSVYRNLLAKNFNPADGSEGPFEYELCYSCHRRESILANESFFFHDLHLSVVGASCRTCHTLHGTPFNTHLIDFDNISVSPSGGGRREFVDLGTRAGQCYLTCHGRDHDPLSYPVQIP